jgi:hypothetical protein
MVDLMFACPICDNGKNRIDGGCKTCKGKGKVTEDEMDSFEERCRKINEVTMKWMHLYRT